jgi:hypothetical protein
MNLNAVSHWIIGSIINLIVIFILVTSAWDGNDKAIILVIVYYPVLVMLNVLVWLLLRLLGRSEAGIYGSLVLILLTLYIPVLLISTLY